MSGHRAVVLGRVVISTTMQASGAPVVDRCLTWDQKTHKSYRGWAILLKLWRARTAKTIRSRALVVAVEQ